MNVLTERTASSAAGTPLAKEAPWYFRPRWFVVGLVAGLILMSLLGRRAGKTDFHPDFTRFIPPISPEANYFPTIDEMTAIVRARCSANQVLVIVGGNSVLQGVWQPADEMWTRHLQADLGAGYCVINLAFRGASPTDGGALVAEALRKEFPRQIYVANERPMNGIGVLGSTAYRPFFWQAYFGGYLLTDSRRDQVVKQFLSEPENRWSRLGLVGSAVLDRVLHFNNLWTRTAFETVNSIPSIFSPAPPALFAPRSDFKDAEPDGSKTTIDEKYPVTSRAAETQIVRDGAKNYYIRTSAGGWAIKPLTRGSLTRQYLIGIPVRFHARTLLLFGRDSPFFRKELEPTEREREEQSIGDIEKIVRELGYHAADYGADFNDLDYGDRSHLAPSGGEKLAASVAPVIKSMAAELGYLK